MTALNLLTPESQAIGLSPAQSPLSTSEKWGYFFSDVEKSYKYFTKYIEGDFLPVIAFTVIIIALGYLYGRMKTQSDIYWRHYATATFMLTAGSFAIGVLSYALDKNQTVMIAWPLLAFLFISICRQGGAAPED